MSEKQPGIVVNSYRDTFYKKQGPVMQRFGARLHHCSAHIHLIGAEFTEM